MSYVFLFIFFYCRSFSPWWALPFLIFPQPLQNFHVVYPTKKCLLCFLSLVGVCWSVAYFLLFSVSLFSVFQICGHDNLSLYFRQHGRYRNNFVVIDSLVVSASQDAAGYAISAKRTSSCHTCVLIELFLHWYTCGGDGWLGGRVYGHVTTKISWMHRLPNFLTQGAPLRARELC